VQVVAYNRAGYGASEPGPLPRDSGREAAELKALLEALSVRPPYVLVGHSLGGLNAQVFAAQYPEDVGGLVLLDPPPLEWIRGEGYPELRRMADRMTEEWQAIADQGRASSDAEERAHAEFFEMLASEHREMFKASARQAAAIETFGAVPVTVVASGVPNTAFGEVAADYQRYWIDQSRALAAKSRRGEFVLVEESTHRLHEDAEDVVLAITQSMIAKVDER
jgi:pimeloyl-ACP methyl ester carboxylesterase